MIEVAVEIRVGAAHHRGVLVGHYDNGATVDGLGGYSVIRYPAVKEHVDPFAGPQLYFGVGFFRNNRRPWARRVHYHPGGYACFDAGELVAQFCAGDVSFVVFQQFSYFSMVFDIRAVLELALLLLAFFFLTFFDELVASKKFPCVQIFRGTFPSIRKQDTFFSPGLPYSECMF